MKISKKNLLKIITEGQEMDEFAERSKGTQNITNKISKFRPLWFPGNDNDKMPDGWIVNKDKVPGGEVYFLFLNGKDQEEWEIENAEFLEKLHTEINKPFQIVAKKATSEHPRNKMTGLSYVPSGNKNPLSKKLKIVINKLVNDTLATPEVNARLEKLSIPMIRARDTKHLNRYGEMSNEKIVYETHSFNSYLSSNQFLNFVVARIQNKPITDEFKDYHLARQFNQIYQNWSETTKNDKSYMGKTDAYKLDKYGMDEANLDVAVRMDLSIRGYLRKGMDQDKYEWAITFKTRFGRKLHDSQWMSGLSPDKNKVIVKTIDLEPGVRFDDEDTVLDNFEIKNALIEALSELRDVFFKEYKPIETLKLANFKQSDVIKTSPIGR